ncbi:MAG: helix-turn-helix domain-containing protein [Candidatus Methylomirabilales bacterium]
MTLNPEESHRLHVLSLLERGRTMTAQAAEALGITPRQVRRLRRRLQQYGPEGLAHGSRGRRSPRRLPDALRSQIVALARGRYAGLNDHHLTEKLTTVEGLAVSRTTVRRVLRAAGVVSPRRRRPPRHRSRRPRRPPADERGERSLRRLRRFRV